MDAPSTTPHDAVFKQFLMHAETARDFLEIHLPVELRELCDLNTLHLGLSHDALFYSRHAPASGG